MRLMRVSGKLQGTAEGPWTDSSCVAKLTVDIQEAKIQKIPPKTLFIMTTSPVNLCSDRTAMVTVFPEYLGELERWKWYSPLDWRSQEEAFWKGGMSEEHNERAYAKHFKTAISEILSDCNTWREDTEV